MTALLIEIGVEELPAIPLLKAIQTIENRWKTLLDDNGLSTGFKFFYTPRRLVFWHTKIATKQANIQEEYFGPPLKIAFKDKKPTGAALGFAKKCGVNIQELGQNIKNGNEVLYYKKEINGKQTKDLLELMIKELIGSIPFGKMMRWGDRKDSFIRPIRWLGILLGNELVDSELFGVRSALKSYGHRSLSYDPFSYNSSGDYFCKLLKYGIVLDQNERKEKILTEFKALEKKHNIVIEIDKELLFEVVAITEYSTPLLGDFDEAFLVLPQEVIITSMKEHQRYFPVFKNGVLSNHFVVVSNALTDDFSKVIAGNQRVLRPRLADGLFFWHNDLKRGLSNSGLEKITFMKGLGSMQDKVDREVKIGTLLTQYLDLDLESLKKAQSLSKADLMSEMVYEFTELQGLMGYYYAKEKGLSKDIALAIKEQYLPNGEESELPSTQTSALTALSYKLDLLMGLFSIDQIPTGSRDPFALRRAVVGIIKIVNAFDLAFDIKEVYTKLKYLYKDFNYEKYENFFIERMYQHYNEINVSIINAVLGSNDRDLSRLDKKIKALAYIVQNEGFKSNFSTFKRVANIVKDFDINNIYINENLLVLENEKSLYQAYKKIKSQTYNNYKEELNALFSLKDELDNFFESVMVNAEDEKIKNNRNSLIATIYMRFKLIADLKEISI